jgi:hypothetical protein
MTTGLSDYPWPPLTAGARHEAALAPVARPGRIGVAGVLGQVRRRDLLGATACLAAALPSAPAADRTTVIASARPHPAAPPFERRDFNMVGVFDIDWLVEPRFDRLLDNFAASPGAFGAVRVFGALNTGARENVFPTTGGRVWMRPDEPIDFSVTFAALEQYLELYRATSEAVRRSGQAVRLGGPVIAYMPDEGPKLMGRFAEFLRREPEVKCDFISFHRKGIWVAEEATPVLQRSITAAREVARIITDLPGRRIDAIVNDEADMKVAFDTPYAPRMTEQFPSYLAAQAIAYAQLSAEFAESGVRFLPASDDANQQLIRAPFDGRRSVMTRLGAADDLAKLPVYGFYEMLRFLSGPRARLDTPNAVQPASDLYHVVTLSADAIAVLITVYPASGEAAASERIIDYRLRDVPWPSANIAIFRIDAALSNAFAAAGGNMPAEVPDGNTARRIRAAQELAVAAPLRAGVPVSGGALGVSLAMRDFTTVLVWVTPHSATVPASPNWLQAERAGGNVVLRWTPNREPWFYSYELVHRPARGTRTAVISPVPLRSALWIETAPTPGDYRYGVRAVSASGMRSAVAWSENVRVSS